jgi:TonB family protein
MSSVKVFLTMVGLWISVATSVCYSQSAVFLDNQFRVTIKEKASFHAEPDGLSDGLFILKAKYLSGAIRFTGSYLDKDFTEPHGFFEYYYLNGNIESRGYYCRGKKVGDWERYDYDGTRRADRIYRGDYQRHEPEKREYESAVFPGGEEALFLFLAQHMKADYGFEIPSGRIDVHVAFVILPSGRLTDFNIVKSGGNDADAEALRIAQSMPWWEPAKRNGEFISSTFVLPIAFGTKSR